MKEMTNCQEKYQALQKEFEDFTYIISHDLSAPMRHIRQFSQLLRENLHDSLDEEGQFYADTIERSVDKMQAMLDGLLRLSRLKTDPSCWAGFNLTDAVEEVMRDFPNITAQYNTAQCAEVFGDRDLLKEVIFNLVDNAGKFQNYPHNINITIDCTCVDEKTLRIDFHDDGLGVAPEKREEIFKPFRKLNAESHFPGLGMGLCISRRIAELHGGSLSCSPSSLGGVCMALVLPAGQSRIQLLEAG